jgi:YihY family inner membrane protein
MNAIERAGRAARQAGPAAQRAGTAADALQQRRRVLAFPVAVWKKFNDDRAGNLAALIAYYGFAAIFPLLLVLATVLNIVLKDNPSLQKDLTDSALAQYPVIGQQIKTQLGSIPGTGLPLIIGAVLLLLGARGVANAMQNALCEVWGIPRKSRPGFPMSQVWSLALLLTVAIGFIVTTFLSGLAGGAGHLLTGVGATVGAVLVSLVLNVGVFWLGFRLATARLVRWRDLLVGALIAAVIWQVLQVAGGYVVSHQLHRANELYGTFGVVLGLVAWLYLQAEATLWAAEVDVVLAKRLWPVSMLAESESESESQSESESSDAAPAADAGADPPAAAAAGAGAPPSAAAPAAGSPAASSGSADRAGPAAPAPRPARDNESADANAPASDGRPARDGKAGKAA